MLPMHVKVDDQVHAIVKIDAHEDGPHHTHRVHLGCGMTIDVDLGGARQHARHVERSRQHADPAWRAQHVELADAALEQGETWSSSRWTSHAGKADCDHCAAVEASKAKPITHETAHTPHATVQADIGTGLPCPTCGSELYIRRRDKTVACTAQGHEFAVPEILATSMGLLHKLAAAGKE